MAELTKEYFNQKLKNLVTQTGLETAFDKQAGMIKRGFDETASKIGLKSVESRLTGVEGEMLKVHDRLRTVEDKLDRVLYKEIDRIEVRVKAIEQKLGLKTA